MILLPRVERQIIGSQIRGFGEYHVLELFVCVS